VTDRPSSFERTIRHERLVLIAVLGAALLLAWTWIVVLSRDMYGSMTGASAWMMTPRWDATHVALLFAMWSVMMAAMMLPSASPLLLLYGGVARRTPAAGYRPSFVYLIASGYLAVWTVFSAAATIVQRLLSAFFVLDPMMTLVSRRTSGVLLVAAGVYQLLPIKRTCLAHCRAPVSYLTAHAAPGAWGAFRLGLHNGFYCLGCCWVLMLLLFAGGVMNLWVIGGLAVVVLIEKIAPFGDATRALVAALLIGGGIWIGWTA
jgi:predicted metal-binding membrane protein